MNKPTIREVLEELVDEYSAIQGSSDDVDFVDKEQEKLLDQAIAEIEGMVVPTETEIGMIIKDSRLATEVSPFPKWKMLCDELAQSLHAMLKERVE